MTQKIKIKIDSEAKSYQPFTVLTMVAVLGVFIFYLFLSKREVPNFLSSHYWHLFSGTLAFEMVAIFFVFPNELIELTHDQSGIINYRFLKDSIAIDERQIIAYDYWWNYAFDSNSTGNKFLDVGNNSGLNGSGTANKLNLYLKLTDSKGHTILLREVEGNWVSTPSWPYRLEDKKDHNTSMNCFYLQRSVKRINQLKGSYT